MDGVQLPQGYSHFEEAVYFLPLSSQKFLVSVLHQNKALHNFQNQGQCMACNGVLTHSKSTPPLPIVQNWQKHEKQVASKKVYSKDISKVHF